MGIISELAKKSGRSALRRRGLATRRGRRTGTTDDGLFAKYAAQAREFPQREEFREQLYKAQTEQSPLASVPSLPREILSGAGAAALDFGSVASRAVGAERFADTIDDQRTLYQAQAATDRRDDWSPWLSEQIGGAARSVATVLGAGIAGRAVGLAGALQSAGTIGLFTAEAMNDAYLEGERQGLRGNNLQNYMLRAGAAEAVVTSVFQAAGAGGLEKGVTPQIRTALAKRIAEEGRKGAGKEFLKELGAEELEELTIEALNVANEQASLTKDMTPEEIAARIGSTIVQTGLVMGGTRTLPTISAIRKAPDADRINAYLNDPSRSNYKRLPDELKTLEGNDWKSKTKRQEHQKSQEFETKAGELFTDELKFQGQGPIADEALPEAPAISPALVQLIEEIAEYDPREAGSLLDRFDAEEIEEAQAIAEGQQVLQRYRAVEQPSDPTEEIDDELDKPTDTTLVDAFTGASPGDALIDQMWKEVESTGQYQSKIKDAPLFEQWVTRAASEGLIRSREDIREASEIKTRQDAVDLLYRKRQQYAGQPQEAYQLEPLPSPDTGIPELDRMLTREDDLGIGPEAQLERDRRFRSLETANRRRFDEILTDPAFSQHLVSQRPEVAEKLAAIEDLTPESFLAVDPDLENAIQTSPEVLNQFRGNIRQAMGIGPQSELQGFSANIQRQAPSRRSTPQSLTTPKPVSELRPDGQWHLVEDDLQIPEGVPGIEADEFQGRRYVRWTPQAGQQVEGTPPLKLLPIRTDRKPQRKLPVKTGKIGQPPKQRGYQKGDSIQWTDPPTIPGEESRAGRGVVLGVTEGGRLRVADQRQKDFRPGTDREYERGVNYQNVRFVDPDLVTKTEGRVPYPVTIQDFNAELEQTSPEETRRRFLENYESMDYEDRRRYLSFLRSYGVPATVSHKPETIADKVVQYAENISGDFPTKMAQALLVIREFADRTRTVSPDGQDLPDDGMSDDRVEAWEEVKSRLADMGIELETVWFMSAVTHPENAESILRRLAEGQFPKDRVDAAFRDVLDVIEAEESEESTVPPESQPPLSSPAVSSAPEGPLTGEDPSEPARSPEAAVNPESSAAPEAVPPTLRERLAEQDGLKDEMTDAEILSRVNRALSRLRGDRARDYLNSMGVNYQVGENGRYTALEDQDFDSIHKALMAELDSYALDVLNMIHNREKPTWVKETLRSVAMGEDAPADLVDAIREKRPEFLEERELSKWRKREQSARDKKSDQEKARRDADYTRDELMEKTVADLKNIAKSMGVWGVNKTGYVDNILAAMGEETNYGTPSDPNQPALSGFFLSRIKEGRGAKNKNGILKLAQEAFGEPVDRNTPAEKQVQEAYELALVKRARERIAEGQNPDNVFQQLLGDYDSQPTLGIRTSSSRRAQAYSTPAPLAYLASQLAGVGPDSTVYDSSAGNGMLLIGADVSNVRANELQERRAENLRSQGIDTNVGDGTEFDPEQSFDAIIVNPPFGTVTEDGKKKTFKVDDYETNDVDRAIALKALKSMKSDGRAVLILGSKAQKKSGESHDEVRARARAYRGKQNVAFFNELYDNYNVVSHSVVDGDLYLRMGAGFDVDMIVIDGKGKSSLPRPFDTKAMQPPAYYESWEDLWNGLADKRSEAGLESGRIGTGDTSEAATEGADPAPVPPGTEAESPVAGRPAAPEGSGRGVPGAVGGEVATPGEQVSESGDTGSDVSGLPERGPQRDPTSVPTERPGQQGGGRGDTVDSGSQDVAGADASTDMTPEELEAAFEAELASQLGTDKPSPRPSGKPRSGARRPQKPSEGKKGGLADFIRRADENASEALSEAVDEINDILDELGLMSGIPVTPRLVSAVSKFAIAATRKSGTSFARFVAEAIEKFGESYTRDFAPHLEAAWNAMHKIGALPEGAERVESGSVESELVKNNPVVFNSGLTRSNKELILHMDRGEPVGIAALAVSKKKKKGTYRASPPSKNVQKMVADYANDGGQVFIDSGAFSHFDTATGRNKLDVDWGKVFDVIGNIIDKVEPENRGNLVVVVPDIINDHRATYLLQEELSQLVNDEIIARDVRIIIPVQRGEGDDLKVNWAEMTGLYENADQAILGIPFNAASWSIDDVLDLLRLNTQSTAAYKEQLKGIRARIEKLKSQASLSEADRWELKTLESRQEIDWTGQSIHLLAGGYKKVESLLRAAQEEGLDYGNLFGDAMTYLVTARKAGRPQSLINPNEGHRGDPLVAKKVEARKEARKVEERAAREEMATEETEHQITYKPRSRMASLSTFVPRQLQDSIDRAMDEIEDEYGPVDDFVAKELGVTVDEIADNEWWSAEQMDAIAMGIHNHKQGNAYIVGDQTGIGKGRVVAGMVRYAEQQGLVPLFVTEKANLFSDIVRDLSDTGLNSEDERYEFIHTNNTSGSNTVTLDEPGEKRVLNNGTAANTAILKRAVSQFGKTGKLRDPKTKTEYRAVFTTYTQMQPVSGEQKERHSLLRELSHNAFVVMDESHNAGGSGGGNANSQSAAEFAREILANASGATFSSATYAKNPLVMDLYAITGMDAAVDNPEDLRDAIAAGGVPLQQVVSAMLAESGKYVRRERTYDGVGFDAADVKVDMDNIEDFAAATRAINDMNRALQGAIEDVGDEVGEGGTAGIASDTAVGDVSVGSTNFTALLHNIIDNMLIAVKAEAAADAAIKSIQDGESPILTVDKTMKSRLDDFTEENQVGLGQPIDMTFKDVMRFYLRRARRYTITEEGREPRHEYIEPEDMDPQAREAYEKAARMVEDISEDIPASPIDFIRHKVEKAGYTVREITGRDARINYSDEGNTYVQRDQSEMGSAGKIETVRMFNDGEVDLVIMNRSAASGLSMHASTKFKNQKTRRMIIAEPDKNVDTFMQLLGRIHRTGQRQPPNYTLLLTDAPAEKRPAAVLMKKLASLNANVTGKSKGKVGFDSVTDIVNQVGDTIVFNYMRQNDELNELLGQPIDPDQQSPRGAAGRVTGWLAMAPVDLQNQFWDGVTEEYNNLVEELNRANKNPLLAQTMDYQARTLASMEIFEGDKESSNPFAQPAKVETAIINVVQKPHSSQTVRDRLAKFYGLDDYAELTSETPASWQKQTVESTEKEFSERVQPLIDRKRAQVDSLDQEKQPKAHAKAVSQLSLMEARYEESKRVVHAAISKVPPGTVVGYIDRDGGSHRGVVTGLKRSGSPVNPYTNGSWRLTIAVADGMREFSVPLTQAGQVSRSGQNRDDLISTYDDLQQVLTEQRHIVTGNLLAGVNQMGGKGQITFFTDDKGVLRHGILMPADFSLRQWQENQPVSLETVDHALEFLRHNSSAQLTDPAGLLSAGRTSKGRRKIEVRNNRRAGIYHQDSRLLELLGADNEFAGTGKWMRANLPADIETQRAIIERLLEIAPLQAATRRDEARGITGARLAYAGDKTRLPMRKGKGKKTKEDDKKSVRVDQIVSRLSKDFEVHISDGKPLIRRAFAEYREREGIIRAIRSRIGDLGMLLHEVAHAIDFRMGLVYKNKGLPTRVTTELMKNDYDPARSDPKMMKAEGFAEFVRQWMSDTDSDHKALQARMPETMKWWKETLKANPELGSKLKNARSLVDRYYSQTPRAMARSQIRSAPEEVRPIDETMSERLAERLDTARERFNKAWVDRLSPIQLFDKATQEAGYELQEGQSMAHALASGFDMTTDHHSERAVTTGIHTVTPGQTEILAEGLEAVLVNAEIDRTAQSEDYDRAVEYAISRFQLEYAEVNPEYRGAWDKEVSESIIESTSPEDAARYDIFTDGLSDYARGLLKLKVKSGVLTRQEANKIVAKYKTYIPLWRAVEGASGTGKRGTVDLSNRVRRRSRKGSDAPVLDPMIALIEDTRLTYDRVLKEEVLKQVGEQWHGVSLQGKSSLKNLIEEIPPKVNVTTLSVDEIAGQIRKQLQSQGIDPDFLDDPELREIMVKVYRTNVSPHATAHHVYLPDGKGGKTLVKMNEHLFDALLGSSPVVSGLVGKTLAGFTKAQKLGATGWSTAFAFGNMFRDWQQYQRTSRYQGNALKRAIDPFYFAGVYLAQRYGKKDNQVAELYREWAGMLATRFGAGGRFKGVDVRDVLMGGPQDQKSNLVWGAGQKIKRGAQWFTEMVAASDVGPRLAEFSNVLKSHGYERNKRGKIEKDGKEQLPPRSVLVEAITAANDVTVNFKKRGDKAATVSKFVPFFSAAIAGLNKFKRVWWDGVAKGDRTQANREAVLVAEMVSAALTVAYAMMRWDDDDYEEEDAWLKNYWTFTDGEGNPIIRLPKGREDALISNVVEAATVAFMKRSPEPFSDMSQVVGHNFMLPFQASLISPVFEAAANYDAFRKMDIEYDGPGAKSPQQRKREFTTKTAELFSNFLGKTPLDRVSPIKVDFLIDRLSGGLGRPVLMLGEGAVGAMADIVSQGEVSQKSADFMTRSGGRLAPWARFTINRDYGKSLGEFYDAQQERAESYAGYENKEEVPDDLRYQVYKDTQVREILSSISGSLESIRNRADRFRLEKYSAGLTRWAMGKEPLDRYPNPFAGKKLPETLSNELNKQLGGWIKSAISEPESDSGKRQKAQALRLLKDTGVSRTRAIAVLDALQKEGKLSHQMGTRKNQILRRNKQKRTLRELLK